MLLRRSDGPSLPPELLRVIETSTCARSRSDAFVRQRIMGQLISDGITIQSIDAEERDQKVRADWSEEEGKDFGAVSVITWPKR